MAKLKPWLGGLCLAASLGAHGVLLGLPWSPSADETEDLAAIEEPPTMTMDVAVLPTPQAPAEPEPTPPVVRPAATRPAAVATNPSPRAIPPNPQVAPESIPDPAEPLADPEPPITEPIATNPEPEPTPEPTPEPEAQPFADFPHFQGAQQADCGGEACWTSPVEGGWRGAARSIQDNLEAQGYTLNNVTGEVLSTETGVRVYQVTKDGEAPYYLNLVSVAEGILYSLTPTPLTEDRLVALQAL